VVIEFGGWVDVSLVVIAVIATGLLFDFTNGFHDTANAMATSIATRALSPKVAVALAGVLNIVGAFLSVQVAKTVSGGLVEESKITPVVIFGGLVGAILWNLASWLLSVPSSSSHALFGGLIGATWVYAGTEAIKFDSVLGKVLLPLALSPIVAGIVALIATRFAYRITSHGAPDIVANGFRRCQVVSASLVALAHGTNDAQKTMGVITLALITVNALPKNAAPPFWVIGVCGLAIGLGTISGGWRIIRTLGKQISDIESPQGFTAETSSTTAILSSTSLGFALSTTQIATGSIFGASAGRRSSTVQWSVARRIGLSWLVTLPAAGAAGALAGWIAEQGAAGTSAVALALVVLGAGAFALSRRNPVTAKNVNDTPVPSSAAATAAG
jgi:inorganic phosphate transporter, PiT family